MFTYLRISPDYGTFRLYSRDENTEGPAERTGLYFEDLLGSQLPFIPVLNGFLLLIGCIASLVLKPAAQEAALTKHEPLQPRRVGPVLLATWAFYLVSSAPVVNRHELL